MAGLTVDKAKYFDSLEYALMFAIMRAYNVPEKVVQAWENYTTN